MSVLFPKPLKPGDKVALIAPSGPIFSTGRLEYAAAYLAGLGFEVKVGKSCQSHYGHLAGDDATRAADVNWAFGDASISGIFCARGGNGAGKILDKIDFKSAVKNPKFFCGYSDITALHTALNRAGLATFHMPLTAEANFEEADDYTLGLMEKFIFNPLGNQDAIPFPLIHDTKTLFGGIARGVLCGGNLSCLSTLMGTPYEIDTKDKIFFIEEVGTNPPRIDRILNGMRLAGKFEHCVGVIFGDFTRCDADDPAFSLTIEEILHNLNLIVPSIYNFPCGHIMPTASLPLGASVRLDATNHILNILR
jgi:muramoyltetrapeptide carboxypeptidase